MSRRTRVLAGLLALTALTLSFAESVWAATCTPAMQMDAPVAPAPSSDAGPRLPLYGTGHDAMEDALGTSEDGRPCPFSTPAAAQACSGVASVPARPTNLFASWSQGAPTVFSVEKQNDLLLEAALFHPPRA